MHVRGPTWFKLMVQTQTHKFKSQLYFMVVNDKLYLHIWFMHSWYTFFLISSIFLGYTVHPVNFFKSSQISKNFSNIIIEKSLCISRPMKLTLCCPRVSCTGKSMQALSSWQVYIYTQCINLKTWSDTMSFIRYWLLQLPYDYIIYNMTIYYITYII